MSSNSLIPHKYRNRMDRLAPYVAFRALSDVSRKRLPDVIRRLYDLAEDQDPQIALAAIEKILKFSGVQALAETGIRLAAEAAGGGEEPEEDDRVARRKRLARKFGTDSAPAA